MPINPEIRDQAYQFFIEEAPELLQAIEAGLLILRQQKSTATVHNIMRSAHSIKGGAASVELDTIATLAHRLENLFKALYSDTLEIDTDLESQLLQAYDCLRLPLLEQIETGYFDAEQALATGEPIFAQLEERLGDSITQGDTYIPTSAELGIDMTRSIFEVDVTEGLKHLENVVAHPSNYEVAGELRAQVEVFAGFAEFLNLPGFGAIAKTTLAALNAHPNRALEITQLALVDFQLAKQAILAGDRTGTQISPSPSLAALTDSGITVEIGDGVLGLGTEDWEISDEESLSDSTLTLLGENWETEDWEISPTESLPVEATGSIPSLEDIFSSTTAISQDSSEQLTDAVGEEEFEETLTTISGYQAGDTALVPDTDTDAADFSNFIPIEGVADAAGLGIDQDAYSEQENIQELPLLEEVFGSVAANDEATVSTSSALVRVPPTFYSLQESTEEAIEPAQTLETLEVTVQNIEQIFEHLPTLEDIETQSSSANPKEATAATSATASRSEGAPIPNLSVRVDLERLGRMNNLVGELAINRNGLSLQNEQLQGSVRELLNRFSKVQGLVGHLRKVSDQMLISTSIGGVRSDELNVGRSNGERSAKNLSIDKGYTQQPPQLPTHQFDSLELDSYGVLHSQLQGLLEEMMQLEESVDDIVLFAKATDQTLERQRQMLTQLRDELMWARMLPLGEVLNRYPRMLRDLSATYHKPVRLKLSGTGVLVDKAVLEKLYDPLLHLLRNAFDHGIEPPEIRHQRNKPEQGQIEIKAYHRGSQTIIEVIDDGQGLNLDRIRQRALELRLLSADQLATTTNSRLFNLIFEPGFSTASEVSELSGRGVGLDVVRSQLRSLKGTIAVSSSPGVGTTFSLRLPLTLTIAKLLVCFSGSTAVALPSDSIEEIVIPKPDQVKYSGSQPFLHWRGEIVPTHRLSELLEYSCPLPETSPSRALMALPTPDHWALPLLVLRQESTFLALEVDRLVTEQELVIKPFGSAIAPPSCTYGCTILGDGSVIPVIDAAALLDRLLTQKTSVTAITTTSYPESAAIALPSASATNEDWLTSKIPTSSNTVRTPTILVVDDAVALRRTLALSLERVGVRVLQARDGREALERLQQSSSVDLVICDIEMPNMNGFEFLSHRRQDPKISDIPVVMLTSRSNDKHRWLAMQLGANAYFTKPYLEQEFLGAIKQIMLEATPEALPV